jgi:hypothetical protein
MFAEFGRLLDAQLRLAVTMQIEAGKTWQDIGRALGVSRQAAFKRFSKA